VTNQAVSMASGLGQTTGCSWRSIKRLPGARNSSPRSVGLVLAVLATGCLPGVASASMRCGSRLIDTGISSAEVSSFCGAPTQVDRVTGTGADVQIEIWTYNFGPDKLMERVRIENAVVVDIQSLGYGFNNP
jgi:Protein of unknown function (DUF2845)